MKKIYFLLVAAALFASCDDAGKQRDHANNDSLPPVTHTATDTAAITNALSVSQQEMKDDSVFSDGSIPSSWANAGIRDVKGLKLFLKQAQQWVMNNDKAKLAAAIKYPLKNIKNEQELIAAYDAVFTKEVKLSFASINFNQVFRNQNGVMLEGGKVWINQFGNDFKIFAINP